LRKDKEGSLSSIGSLPSIMTGWRAGSLSPFSSGCRDLALDFWSIPDMLSYWGSSLLLLTFTQHLQYKTEMETVMVYDSAPQMPKHQGQASNTPGKIHKANIFFVKHGLQGSWEARVLCPALLSVIPFLNPFESEWNTIFNAEQQLIAAVRRCQLWRASA
jgi:hypothetical protein